MAFQKTVLDQLPQRGFFFFATLRSVRYCTIVLHPDANSTFFSPFLSKISLYHSFSSSQCNRGNTYIRPPLTRYSWPFNHDFRDRRTGPIACVSRVSAMISSTAFRTYHSTAIEIIYGLQSSPRPYGSSLLGQPSSWLSTSVCL